MLRSTHHDVITLIQIFGGAIDLRQTISLFIRGFVSLPKKKRRTGSLLTFICTSDNILPVFSDKTFVHMHYLF